jgi:hypothetical protein
MVDAQDRPCETSIGHWWIPIDAVWQGPIDHPPQGEPTPLVEKYLRPVASAREDEEGLSIRHRRQS